MKQYEITFLVEEEKTLLELEKLLSSFDGKKETEKFWGKRELAYPINKKNSAMYYTWTISMDPKKIKALETKIQYDSLLLRYLLMAI